MSLEVDKQECQQMLERLQKQIGQAQQVLNESQKMFWVWSGRLEQIEIQLKRESEAEESKPDDGDKRKGAL